MLSKQMKASDEAKQQSTDNRSAAKAKAKTKAKAKAEAVVAKSKRLLTDEDAAAYHEYKIKMTKWASGTLATVTNDMFWLLLIVQNTARSPLTHFMAHVQKHSRNRLLMGLSCGQASVFLQEYKELIHTFEDWFGKAVEESKATQLPGPILHLLKSMADHWPPIAHWQIASTTQHDSA